MTDLPSPSTLGQLLAPVTVAEFLASTWEQRHLHVARAAAAFYDPALPPEPLARLAFELEPIGRVADENPDNVRGPVDVMGAPELRGAPRGAAVPKEGRVAAYQRGATLRVNDVQHRSAGVGALAASVGQELGAVVGANLYVVQAGAPTIGMHVDPHDVYILQLRGRKRWQLFAGKKRLPIVARPSFSFQRVGQRTLAEEYDHKAPENRGEPIADVTLEQGDSLYLPRGTFHLVSALDRDSMHVTLGVWPTTVVDWLTWALMEAADRDERLRRALPPGLVRTCACDDGARQLLGDAARAFTQEVDADASLALLSEAFATLVAGLRRSDTPRRAAALDPDAAFERDPSAGAEARFDGPRVRVAAANRSVDLAGRFAPAIARALDGRPFRVAELPGDLDAAARAQLVDRLFRLGALREASR